MVLQAGIAGEREKACVHQATRGGFLIRTTFVPCVQPALSRATGRRLTCEGTRGSTACATPLREKS